MKPWIRPLTKDVALEMLAHESVKRQIELGVRDLVLAWQKEMRANA